MQSMAWRPNSLEAKKGPKMHKGSLKERRRGERCSIPHLLNGNPRDAGPCAVGKVAGYRPAHRWN